MKRKIIDQSVTKKVLILLSFVFIITSCQQDVIEPASVGDSRIERINNESASHIPYADSLDLAIFKSDDEVVSYNLIRKLAMIELSLEGFNKDMNWDGHKLSEYPVILYGFDSKPKFYEFMVLDAEGKEIGAVRTHSRRKTGGVLNQVSDNVKDYQSLTTKSGAGSKFFADYGGNLYGGFVSKSGESPTTVVDLTTGERENNPKELSDEEILDDLSTSLRESSQEAIKVTDTITNPEVKEKIAEDNPVEVETQIDSLQQRMHIEHKQRDEYWKEIEEKTEELLETSDEEIVAKSKGWFDWFTDWFESYNDSDFYLSEYKNNLTGYTPNTNQSTYWCGPYIMGWMLHTKTGKYEYDYFLNYTYKMFDGRPMFPWQMFWSMLRASNWRIWVMPWFSSGRHGAYWHVRGGHNPVVILTRWGTHWKVGYGSKRKGWKKWPRYYFATKDNSGYHEHDRASWFFLYLRVYN